MCDKFLRCFAMYLLTCGLFVKCIELNSFADSFGQCDINWLKFKLQIILEHV